MEEEFDVAKMYVTKFNGDDKPKMTTTKLLLEYCEVPKTMPAAHLALKLAATLAACTANVGELFLCPQKHRGGLPAVNGARSQI